MKYSSAIFFLFNILCGCFFLSSCKHDNGISESDYPPEIETILKTNCATAGCHTNASKAAAAGLSLETWNNLFEGGNGGSVIIPYRDDYSTLLYYVNTDSLNGLALTPTMPLNKTPLSTQDYNILKNWIINGAPDKNGFVKFSDDPMRKKFYVSNQGCDEVTVFDATSKLAMRYIKAGASKAIESPHVVKVAPNNLFCCVSFLGSSYFQKFSTANNQLIGSINIGSGSWKSFTISSDSKTAYVIDWSYGKIAVVNLDAMTVQIYPGLTSPNGSALNATDDTLYVTSLAGNFIYKIPVNNLSDTSKVSMTTAPVAFDSSLPIHEISFSPDGSEYFITCESNNEVRVLKTSNDSLLAIIPVGALPQEMSFSKTHPYLFVSCTEDETTFPGKHGSVYIINYQTHTIVGTVYTGHQPQGIAVDDENNCVYVANRNVSVDGIPSHHGSVCDGKNGYVTAIDLNTLQLIDGFRTEVSVDAYYVGITH